MRAGEEGVVTSDVSGPGVADPRPETEVSPGGGPASAPDLAEFGLDELSARTGISARNIRYYTTRGLLPPPAHRGRVAVYGSDHLARLDMVRALQGHGFTLAAIEGYLANVPTDASPDEVQLQRTLIAPWVPAAPEALTADELCARAGRDLDERRLHTLSVLGVARPRDDGRFDVDAARLSTTVSLLDLDLPAEAVVAAQEAITAHGRAVATELYEVFRTIIWPAYQEAGLPPERLREAVERFKPVTVGALVAAFEEAVSQLRREFVARRAGDHPDGPASRHP